MSGTRYVAVLNHYPVVGDRAASPLQNSSRNGDVSEKARAVNRVLEHEITGVKSARGLGLNSFFNPKTGFFISNLTSNSVGVYRHTPDRPTDPDVMGQAI